MSVPPSRIDVTSTQLNIVTVVTTMRSLFADMVRWIGTLLVSIVFNLPDREALTARLMRNAADFARTFRQFYGEEYAGRLQLLLTAYYRTMIDLADAYKANDMEQAAALHAGLYAIIDQLAPFLAERNRNLDATALQVSLYELTDLLEKAVVALFSGDYEKAIQNYDQAADQALVIAEDLAYGIVRQLQI